MKSCRILLLLLTIQTFTVFAQKNNPATLSKTAIDSLEDVLANLQGDKLKIAQLHEQLGNLYHAKDENESALRNFQEGLKLYEELDNLQGTTNLYTSIGKMYFDQKDNPKALEYYRKALTNAQKLNEPKKIIEVNLGIAEVYEQKGDLRTAREYNLRALESAENIRDEKLIGNALSNLGDVFVKLGSYQDALQYTLRSLEIKRNEGDKAGMAHVLTTMGEIYAKLGQFDKASSYFQEGLQLAQQINVRQLQLNLYLSLFEYYESKKEYPKALEYHKDYVLLKDSLFNIARDRQLSELSVRYESAKKERENLELQQKIAEDQATLKGKNQLLTAIGIGAIILLALGLWILRDNQKLKQLNALHKRDEMEIKRKNEELEKQQEEINKRQEQILEKSKEVELQKEEVELKSEQLQFAYEEINETNAELREQKEAMKQQNAELRHKNLQITESIRYAKDIQEVFLPSEKRMQEAFAEHFVLSKPKDIVSGDFYWLSQKEINGNKKTILVTADCTGHGVPGALLSIIGGSILNQLIDERNMTQPEEILQALNDNFVATLQQEDSNIGDSMDISLCIIDHSAKEIAFSGTKMPIFYVQDGEIYELKGNPRHIGGLHRQRRRNVPFTTTKFSIGSPTVLYMISDGFYHQFGGTPFRKFMRDNFKKLLLEVSNKNLADQKVALETTLSSWMYDTDASIKPFPQIDDILVIGVKL
ncbi:MAG: tetratricopeptide repeat protein [Thermoflexibacter sp.]|nr:tetratricopeptide repeat protein [Thermoflexibacter sp.]